ncbi:MAG: HesA/MoeB/ThiF family protein [Armatimonadetes bacterium]|nr:HesA/MoeB/ThiF family protein [Armatimonadota bacterium]MDW8122415.1 HesA/MoeB/ThiF family protein [Armatimonadota bacterium]
MKEQQLGAELFQRYDRQMRLWGWGWEGQERLSRATVAVCGIGGLGCPCALYLAAAGVGTLILIDSDRVEITNLNRQILHTPADIGKPKVQSAAEKLQIFNPQMTIVPIEQMITEETLLQLVKNADVIVDALDNYPTRLLLNQYAVRQGKPLVHGAIYGWEGRATTILPGETPCLACLFEEGPPPGTFPVVGVTPGLIAMIQASEVLKILLGIGVTLAGRYLITDQHTMTFTTIPIKRRPDCSVCSALVLSG